MREEQQYEQMGDRVRQSREERRRMRFERHRERRLAHCRNAHHSNKSWVGIMAIIIGLLWLLKAGGVVFPEWVFDWPMILIAFGLASGIASKFRNFGSIILIFIGGIFLMQDFVSPDLKLEKFIWPVILIFVGILFIAKRRFWAERHAWMQENREHWEAWRRERAAKAEEWGNAKAQAETSHAASARDTNTGQGDAMDWIDTTIVFGGTKRRILSKNFRGGDVVNIFGGTEIDLTHADIQGTVVLDIVNICGGVRIAVPSNWQVRTNTTHLFAGIDDRRRSEASVQDSGKVLILGGTQLMSGLEILDIL